MLGENLLMCLPPAVHIAGDAGTLTAHPFIEEETEALRGKETQFTRLLLPEAGFASRRVRAGAQGATQILSDYE